MGFDSHSPFPFLNYMPLATSAPTVEKCLLYALNQRFNYTLYRSLSILPFNQKPKVLPPKPPVQYPDYLGPRGNLSPALFSTPQPSRTLLPNGYKEHSLHTHTMPSDSICPPNCCLVSHPTDIPLS